MDGRVKEQPISVKEIPTCKEINKITSHSSEPSECCDVVKSSQSDNKYVEQKLTEHSILPSHTPNTCPRPSTDADEFTVCLDKIEEKFNEFTQNLIKTFECDNSLIQCYGSSLDTDVGVQKSTKNLETIIEEPNKETDGETNTSKIKDDLLSENSAIDKASNSADYQRSVVCLNDLEKNISVSTDVIKQNVNKVEKVSNDCITDSSNKEELTAGCCEVELKATSSEDVQYVNEPKPITGCESPNLTSRTDEKYQTESLDVNVDSSSVCSISDYCQEDLCTQYSDSESVKDIELGDIYCHKIEGIPNSPSIKDELIEACKKEIDVSDYENGDSGCEDNGSNSTLRNLTDKFVKTNGNLVQDNSLVKDLTESDISVYESFYSLDNSCTATPVIGRIKKTLTWTPRILSEERFLNSRSTTLSSKASFYTAETSGTFYSARSLQLDSCDNFVTCEDFQKLKELSGEQKSKLSKAKDALVRGRDFVKSKFDCYRRRLPGLGAVTVGNNSENKKSRNLCHNTCGFSCVSQVGKEISQYSLPDLQSDSKGNSQAVCSLDENVNQLPQDKDTSVVDGSAKVDMAVTMRDTGNKEDDGDPDKDGVNFDEKRNNETTAEVADEGERCVIALPPGQSKIKHESNANTDAISRETTEDGEDDLPVGTEAGTMTQKMKDSENTDESRSKKRLRWVSAIERTSTSINSRAVPRLTACVEQLLYQREMDPEMLLSNLGFGGTFLGDDSLSRIPERFIPQQNVSPCSNQYQMPVNYPEFQQMLPVMGTSQLMHGANSMIQEPVYEKSDEDEIDGNVGNKIEGNQSRKGSMQRPTFSALAQGVKFIHGTQVPEAPPSPDEETKRICAIPSILDFPNRRALARQGFYGDNYLKDLKSDRENGPMKRSMSAAEKRKQFVHSVKSKGNWSLTDENEEEAADDSRDSWDQGLRLKSFSDRFSSDSSLESSDSFSEEQQLVKNKSIKDLRKQYEDAIRNSMDGENPVFTEQLEDSSDKKRKKSISEMRKNQVNQLMTSIDDDGDYVVRTDMTGSSRLGLDPKSILMLAQKSTQSTLTGSPTTPKELGFSFDQTMNDGESEFDFTESDKSDKLLKCGTQSVSIIIEEDPSQLESDTSGEVIQKSQNAADLNTLSLGLRSDSCNTLVPVDQVYDSEGELTPRAGNISPGIIQHYSNSTEKSISLDQSDYDKENVHPGVRTNGNVLKSRSTEDKNSLKPLQHSTQESFELEEVSSGETVYEDFHIHTNKPLLQKGPLEKSVSIHSDSSGFADLDPAGEIIPPGDTQPIQENRSFVTKQQQNVAEQLPKKELYVCKRNVLCHSEDDDSTNPSLSTITYSKTEQVMDKSLVFTVNVPIETVSDTESSVSRTSGKSRFVSQVCLNVEAASKDKHYELSKDKSVSKITRVSEVTYMKVVPTGDLDDDLGHDFDFDTENSEKNDNIGITDNVNTWRSGKGHSGNHDVHAPPTSMKNKIRQKIRVKENLVAAGNNPADWLLESNKYFTKNHSTYNVGRPVWASTPNLKCKRISSAENGVGNRIKREGNHSFDLLLDEESGSSYENSLNSKSQSRNQHSLDQFDSRQHFQESRDQSEYSSIDESLDQQSLIGSSCGIPDDHLNYLRLARLVNGPSLMMDVSKMPNAKFTPNFHMKNWMQLPKRKHIEEETLLMQHAVQRYKTELCLMENMLFTLYRTAHPDLTPEERSEVEELQHLWCEVRKEVIKMEELLAERLRSVMTGNDSYSPLDALEIVQQMIDLLREQLYHQQMCIGRDVSFNEEDHELKDFRTLPSSASSTVSETWMSEISNQMSDIKSSISASESSQKKELETRMSELKKCLLSDVKQELSGTENTEMLKLQLQARESEVRRLRMELLLQNVSLGKTRKKQVFESDV